jgi:hypothetical protein
MTARGTVLVAASVALAASFAIANSSLAQEATPFDGDWNAEVVCPASADVNAYSWRLPVRIDAGTLSGNYHSPTTEAEGELSGWVRSDGKSIVSVIGVTGRDQSIGHLRPGTRFHYTANVQFKGDSGSGQRQQLRSCTLNFSRA